MGKEKKPGKPSEKKEAQTKEEQLKKIAESSLKQKAEEAARLQQEAEEAARLQQQEAQQAALLQELEASLPSFTSDVYETKIGQDFDKSKSLFLEATGKDKDIFFTKPSIKFSYDINELIQQQGKFPFNCCIHDYMSPAVRDWTEASLQMVRKEVEDTHPEISAIPTKAKSTQEFSSLPMDESSDTKSSSDDDEIPEPPDLNAVFGKYLAGAGNFTINSEPIQDREIVDLRTPSDKKRQFVRGQFDTECLLFVIIFFNILQNMDIDHPLVKTLTDAYKADNDDDDLMQMDLFDINVPYNILKPLCYFILNGTVDNRGIIASLIDWIKEDDQDLGNIKKLEEILRRIGLKTECLNLTLANWPFIIPRDIPGTRGPKDIKVYSGIGTTPEDANFLNFVYPLTGALHQPIIGSFTLSTAYGFDQAARFCKSYNKNFCMLEIILGPGIQLSLIAESANEAEILLKMGNIYIFKKMYYLIYIRSRPGIEGNEPMHIAVYQFELVDSSNSLVPSFKSYNSFDAFDVLGGSKINKRRKTKRKHYKSKKTKRRTNKKRRKTNKRKQRQLRTNKRRRI
jgi:hypothetical protein